MSQTVMCVSLQPVTIVEQDGKGIESTRRLLSASLDIIVTATSLHISISQRYKILTRFIRFFA